MKKVLFTVFFTLLLGLFSVKVVSACDWSQCSGEADCGNPACSDCGFSCPPSSRACGPTCYGRGSEGCSDLSCIGCPWCLGKTEPGEAVEDITGKVINPVLPLKLNTMPGVTFLSKFLRTGVSLVFVLGMVIFVFILTTGGVRWLSSSGDKAKLEAAQKQVSSGFVGLVILLSAFAIIQLVQVLFGIDLLSFTLPTL